MLTRCPTCDTAFRITPEQLKARGGQVRCGACQRIFNALETLVEEPPVVIAPVETPSETPMPSAQPATAEPLVAARPAENDAHALDIAPLDALALIVDHPPHEGSVTPEKAGAATETHGPTVPVAPVLEEPAPLAAEPEPIIVQVVEPAVAAPEPLPEPESKTEIHPEPEPVPDPLPVLVETVSWDDDFPQPPRQPRRWPWVLASLLAVIALILQVSIAFRVEWAASYPDMKPALAALCQPLGCRIDLPRKPDLIEIETSNLHPEGSNPQRLNLTATLKNRAAFAQQFPHLELTLTDLADKAIARKVLPPGDYLGAATTQEHGMPANGDLAVAMTIDTGDLAASGYRLYVFYP